MSQYDDEEYNQDQTAEYEIGKGKQIQIKPHIVVLFVSESFFL